MKKLLLVTDAWYPQVNGVVRALEKMRELLEKRGFTVIVVHPGMFRTVPLPLYPEIHLALFPRRGVKNILEQERPDFIHVATEGPLGWAARAACKKLRLRFTTSYHTHFHLHVNARIRGFLSITRSLQRRFHNAGSGVMVVNESLRADLLEAGFKNLRLWPLGVDTNVFVRNPNSTAHTFPPPVFAFFSRVVAEKSPEEFMRLNLPGTKIVIGDGPDRPGLEKKYTDVCFVGYKWGQELVDWLSRTDVMVFPSRTETFGLVVLEALACGVPVAAHNVMGPRDIITNGVGGYLSDDLADAAKKCLTLDRTKCREKALKYSWNASVDAFIRNLVPAI